MNNLRQAVQNFFNPSAPKPVPAGIYHYQAPPDDPRNYRMHLRVDDNGRGTLILNAATILHLNETATEYAYYVVQNQPVDAVMRKVANRYNIPAERARQDYQEFIDRLQTLVNTPDLDPVQFLDLDRQAPFSGVIQAPYRLDCALTYRLPKEEPGAAPVERVQRELSTAEWESIIDRAWKAGIPHLVFTGGEPTLRSDLADLLDHAEINGQVTGLITDGLRLADDEYRQRLLATGLDHVTMLLQPELPLAWTALAHLIAEDLQVTVHLTLTADNQAEMQTMLERLADTGVNTLSLSANSQELKEGLLDLRVKASERGFRIVWDLPVPYSALNPVTLELNNHEVPKGAGRAFLYVEPDGDILAAQGVQPVLGNLLNDPWNQIWRSA